MGERQYFKIIGTGRSLPASAVTASEIDERLGESPGWTAKHSGVLSRFECRPPETLASMAYESVSSAITDAGVSWDEVDLLIDCSTSKMRPIPGNAAHILREFGPVASATAGFDIQSTCLGFIVALHTANSLLASGAYSCIIICASEACLLAANWKHGESASLVGDGSAAVVLQRQSTKSAFAFAHETYPEHLELCTIKGGGHHIPVFSYREEDKAHFTFHMNGPAVFKTALSHLPPMVERILVSEAISHISKSQVHFLPHQASPAALRAVRRRLAISQERFHEAASSVGNMAAASIPWLLDKCIKDNSISPGEHVMLLGTSAGYSQAALVFAL